MSIFSMAIFSLQFYYDDLSSEVSLKGIVIAHIASLNIYVGLWHERSPLTQTMFYVFEHSDSNSCHVGKLNRS